MLDDADLRARWHAARAFVVVGCVGVVAGGLVAAVTHPTGFELGSWTAAFLVLVVGVAQICLGAGQAWLAAEMPSCRTTRLQFLSWNLGAALTVVGTLVASPAITSTGGVVTVGALAGFLFGVRHIDPRPPRWAGSLYRGLAGFVLASVPVGLLLSWLRH